jgi:CDP-diacylglycerol---serine O-phosphatidyltransferase
MMILGFFNAAFFVSLAGFLLSMAGILLAVNSRFEGAIIALILAGIMDLFDGLVARRLAMGGEEKRFGIELDSLFDAFNFLFFPSLLLWFSGWNGIPDMVILVLYNLAGIIRLAHFNSMAKEESGKVRYYTGLPVTFAALFIPIFFLARYFIAWDVLSWLIRSLFIVLTVVYVARIPVPKPGGVFYILFPVRAVILIVFYAVRWAA